MSIDCAVNIVVVYSHRNKQPRQEKHDRPTERRLTMKKGNNDNFTGIKQLPSGFYAVFISGVWVDAASANREQAEQKLTQFTNDRYKRPRARNRKK